ncbi:cytochrome c550 [Jeotgalibacillus marinus]|uniref:Cytochrome c550 n=1 Tax=Jeotgalibacillus marinus TaxID=86667 RepID=A0ABV3PZD5_9BACL
MTKNPIIPFVLIMVLGFGVVFFMSIKGLGDNEDIAGEEDGAGEEAGGTDFDPEGYYEQTCIACHGDAYDEAGGAGPSLLGVGEELSVEEIRDILVNGIGAMPAGQVDEANADAMAEWVAAIGTEEDTE